MIQQAVPPSTVEPHRMTTPKMTQQPVSSSTVEPQQMTTPKMIQQPVPPSTVEPHRMTTPKMIQQPVPPSTVEPHRMTTPKMTQQPVSSLTVEPHRMTTPKVVKGQNDLPAVFNKTIIFGVSVAVVCIMAVVMYYVFCRMRTAGYREQDSSPESGIRLQPVPTRSTERSTRSLAASTSPEGDPAKDGEKKTRSYTRGTPQTVIITKQEGQKIGLSIVGGSDSPRGPEFFVKALDPHGLAAASGYIKKNDKIISINRKLLCGLTHKQAIDAFNTFISGRMLIEIQQ
ncbi:uncharacterized protein LOC124719931 [Schistocerca piceifrons]|uniref:uncharacterized protein LOC124719931 n=1 Tax=Schistocerca piceifrons TaxID=274613 RepID=UPI001F5E4BB2|nr:uncharacterized protein LOC124719931 [Schistocerca piceifrons]